MRSKRFLILVIFLLPFVANAGGYSFSIKGAKLNFSGVIDFSMGEIMQGKYRAMRGWTYYQDSVLKRDIPVSHVWFGNPLARLNLDFSPSEKTKVLLGFEGNIFLNDFPMELGTNAVANGGPPTFPQFMDWRMHQAQGIVSILKDEAKSLDLSLGLMPYKYNPEVRNLGEFLFRSGTYPFMLFNNYNFPLARLTGLRLNFRYGSEKFGLTVDQFVLMERENPPLNDISLATIVGANFLKVVDVGVGVDFAHAIPVNGLLTTPPLSTYWDSSSGDTGHYSFKGTKLMARLTIDPIGTFRSDKESVISQIFGENGGKIYGEIAIIGLKNYPASFDQIPNDIQSPSNTFDPQNPWGYTKISERMPWMVGINIPAWKVLDVCAFELEKYPAPYPNDSYQAFLNRGLPIPTFIHYYRDTPGYDSAGYSGDRWYWSLHMKKQVVSHLSMIGQLSRDHIRWNVNAGRENNYDTEEIMPKTGQWGWRLGLLFEF